MSVAQNECKDLYYVIYSAAMTTSQVGMDGEGLDGFVNTNYLFQSWGFPRKKNSGENFQIRKNRVKQHVTSSCHSLLLQSFCHIL